MHHVYESMSTVVDDLLTELGCPFQEIVHLKDAVHIMLHREISINRLHCDL